MPSPDPIRHFTEFAIGAFFQTPEGASGPEQEFFTSTNRMLSSLYDEGLESDDSFRVWREFQQEGWRVTDSIASSIGAMRRDAMIQLLDTLPLPKAIWRGLAHEYHESRLDHVRDHPYQWAEGEERRAELILRQGPPDRLITGFRSQQDVARIASFIFCSQRAESSPGFRSRYGSEILDGGEAIPDISVAPAFRRLDGHLGSLEFAADSPISKLYNPNYSFINRVEISSRQLNNRSAQLASEAHQALLREGGEIPEDRAQVLAEQGGRFKVFLEPQRWKSTGQGW